jgi:hypothetical protein
MPNASNFGGWKARRYGWAPRQDRAACKLNGEPFAPWTRAPIECAPDPRNAHGPEWDPKDRARRLGERACNMGGQA